jgi:hypothetical protein
MYKPVRVRDAFYTHTKSAIPQRLQIDHGFADWSVHNRAMNHITIIPVVHRLGLGLRSSSLRRRRLGRRFPAIFLGKEIRKRAAHFFEGEGRHTAQSKRKNSTDTLHQTDMRRDTKSSARKTTAVAVM